VSKPQSIRNTLSKKAEKLIAAFDEAAQRHGWQRDQGYVQSEVDGAALEHQKAFEKLRRYIVQLERLASTVSDAK
jgi:hypothetical protein